MEEQISRIAAQVADRLFIEVEASGRHVHLTKEQAVTLFGHGLTPQRPLSQPGQFVCQERVEVLRERTRLADKRAPQVGLTGKCALAVQLIGCHIRSFYQEYGDSLRYLLQLGAFHATRRGQHLLDTEHIRWNTLRFCESAAVLELLILDIVLFLYLGSDDTCSRFFELLSTVIIIPILLSSLDRLKENKPR